MVGEDGKNCMFLVVCALMMRIHGDPLRAVGEAARERDQTDYVQTQQPSELYNFLASNYMASRTFSVVQFLCVVRVCVCMCK